MVCPSPYRMTTTANTQDFVLIELYRGLHAVQGGEQGSCTLSEGRQESDAMCDRPVSNRLLAYS